MMTGLTATDISKARGSRWVLQNVSFTLTAGQVVHLRGANGAGKSTLLHILAGAIAPSTGQVEIDGHVLTTSPDGGRQRLALVPETLLPSPWLTVVEYLQFRAALRHRELEPDTINEWEFTAFAHRPLATLSHGERRRVVLAAAILTQPDVLLLDEPTIGVDERQRDHLAERLRQYAADKLIIVASHIERQGLPDFDRVLTLVEGKLQEPPCE